MMQLWTAILEKVWDVRRFKDQTETRNFPFACDRPILDLLRKDKHQSYDPGIALPQVCFTRHSAESYTQSGKLIYLQSQPLSLFEYRRYSG